MKKVMVVTGTRADYGIYQPILEAVRADEELELLILATGMHLSRRYGYTVEQIERDGFTVNYRVESLLQDSTHGNMARSIALSVLGMTQAFEQSEPDAVLLLGDRGEMLAAAITATHLNILTVHLHGGEVSGTIDESVRHAISKLAHLHLPATNASAERLKRMGEDPWRVHVVGAPRIETIRNATLPSLEEVFKRYDLGDVEEPYFLFVYHPVTTQAFSPEELTAMLEVLLDRPGRLIAIRPNADAGTERIAEVYERFGGRDQLSLVTSFAPLDYLTLLRSCEVLIGNSSSGIIEAASFGVPVINIGTRQNGRERSANTIDIPECHVALREALRQADSDAFRDKAKQAGNVYEHAGTSASTVRYLKATPSSSDWIQKTITY